MKKMITGSLAVAALMATSSAFAAVTNDSLTTKGYVDAGLDYLYQHKQEKLQNNASTPADINASVLTTVRAASSASDTHLVTEKAVRDAITNAAYNDTNLSGRVTTLETAVNGDGTTANPGLLSDVADLQDAIGDGTTTGLAKDVADLQGDVGNLETAVGTASVPGGAAGTGLTGRVETLESDVAALQAGTVSAGSGVTVSGNTVSVAGLSSTTGSDNKMYILKNNQAEELSVADTWSNPWVTP